ncbi:hypothetical protein H2198_006239 [Neophaeococcomyces mojaviensis]|uniref:Uncharacterized protein n=1 Tax=Neophaeococcomyces mojaviensis TaxID=3383035 RepID=A0ACC3A3G1_9EURO|nr:hypothetical protein H2198_006239 [Knufia sp. JES_112]
MSGTKSILFVDAYDSFSRNIIALLYSCIESVHVTVIHIDTDINQVFGVDIERFLLDFNAVVLGPGPGDPRDQDDVGLYRDVWRIAACHSIPVLGICLGFQTLCLRYGLPISRMHEPCHGQTKKIKSVSTDVFGNVSGVVAMNYNSLAVKKSDFPSKMQFPTSIDSGTDSGYSSDSSRRYSFQTYEPLEGSLLQLLAWDDDGYAMAVRHADLPFWGFQFHPESCMSNSSCHELIRNWWAKASQYTMTDRCSTVERQLPGLSLPSPSPRPVHEKRLFSCSHNQHYPTGQPQLGNKSKAEPRWVALKNADLTMEQLSSFCYSMAGSDVVAMLESSAKGRYCIYAFTDSSSETVSYMNGKLMRSSGSQIASMLSCSPQKALEALEDTTKAFSTDSGGPDVPFQGGFMGYISYEMSLDLLNIHSPQESPNEQRVIPDFNFVFVERSIIFDKATCTVYIQSIRANDPPWINLMQARLNDLASTSPRKSPQSTISRLQSILSSTVVKLPDHSSYTSEILTCQSHLHAGNSYELCLTTEATITTPATDPDTPYLLYRNLNKHNPVPFATYLHFPSTSATPSTTILSTSPEQFLSCSRDGTLDMMPMKGTVQRTPTTTLADAISILQTPKESAENLMIADLIRHDLYSVVGCAPYALNPTSTRTDPVEIVKLNEVATYATVYQLTSHIRAHPPPSLNPFDTRSVIAHNNSALHHVLPPGSMTGAPKKRSCEILRNIEKRNRGVYSGIIGYMDVRGGGCWSVAIRTAWSSGSEDRVNKEGEQRKKWHVGAGGAVTVLSEVEGEWQEMMGKLGSVLRGFKS